MPYYSYHAIAKKLIREGKLLSWQLEKNYKGIENALVLFFADEKHPVIPIRSHRHEEYFDLLEQYEKKKPI
jgi:hypothetical protein